MVRRRAVIKKKALFEALGYSPHPGQQQVHDSSHPRRVIASGVRWGKTTCAAMEAIAAALQPVERSFGWVCAPTYDLAGKVFREIQHHLLKSMPRHIKRMRDSDHSIEVINMSGGTAEIRAKSAESPVSLLGEGLDWLIVDEAARLRPMIWERHLSQRLIDKKGWAMLISTPHGQGWFYDLFRDGRRGDPTTKSWNFPSWDNPTLDRAIIDQERLRLPDRVFRQEYGAEFQAGEGAVFRKVRECATGSFERCDPARSYTAGLDLAKHHDYTVLVVLDDLGKVVFVDRYNRIDWGQQITRIAVALRDFWNPDCYVDTTGAGDPIYEQLLEVGLNVKGYQFTTPSKASLINGLVLGFETGKITLPRPEIWPEGIDELEGFEYSITDSGHTRTGAPSGRHDDCVIALALAYHGHSQPKGGLTCRPM